MSATEIKLYDFFRKDLKLDDVRAKYFTEILYESIENHSNGAVTEYKSIFKEDLRKLELQLTSLYKDRKTDMLRWFFGFFVTLVLMILGLYATIIFK